ncbi:MAG TPA: histidine kinase [Flavobacterium sp.]|nr:histidine kinase [Flavobacterium sp.]
MPKSFKAAGFAWLFFVCLTYSQDRQIDSLLTALKDPKIHDTTRLRTIALFRDQNYTGAEKNYYYLSKFLGDLAEKNYRRKKTNPPELQKKYTMWLGAYYGLLGSEYFKKPDHEKGLVYFDKSIALHKEAGELKHMHFAMISKASLYTKVKRYDEAIPYIFKALKYFETHPDEVFDEDFAYAYYALAYVYLNQGKFEKAIEHYNKTLDYYGRYDKNNYVDYQVGRTHNRMATAYFGLKDYAAAIRHSRLSQTLIGGMNDFTLEIENLCRIGLVYLEQGELIKAESMFKQAMALQPDPETLLAEEAFFRGNLSMGRLNYQKGELAKAADYTEKALDIARNINEKYQLSDAANQLYEISLRQGNYKRALEMNQLIQKLDDASKIEASKNAMAQQQLQYDFEKKELKLKLDAEKAAARQQNWLIGLSGMLLLILLGVYFYYRNNKQKQAIAGLEKTQIKQRLLISQMNPHFIFNSVHNIRNLIERHKNEEAVKYLDQFSVLTRQILENSNENYISLEEEVAMIKNYLSIQQLLYNYKFDFSLTVDDTIEPDSTFLPPMLTQPFVENAIKHGLGTKDANGKVNVRFFLDAGKLFFEVTDNGKGFDSAKTHENHKSLAMTITRERLVGYTKNQDFTVNTGNLKDQDERVVGARVSFEIPYIYEN